jgi:hypothetical protein
MAAQLRTVDQTNSSGATSIVGVIGNTNQTKVWQDGQNRGGGSSLDLAQRSASHRLELSQSGGGNHAGIDQGGSGNGLTVQQQGRGNSLS